MSIPLTSRRVVECGAGPVPSAFIRVLIRRYQPGQGAELRFEDLTLNHQTFMMHRAGQHVPLTAKEFDLLAVFITHPRRLLSRDELARRAWDDQPDAFSNVINVMISRLSKKIDGPFDRPYFHTVVNRGYMLSCTPPGGTS